MFEFFSNKNSSKSIILDIQSDLVRGALIEYIDGVNDKIILTYSKSISENLIPKNSQRIKKKILKNVHDVVHHIIKYAGHNGIKHIHYILSTPWVFSELKTLKVDFEKDISISDDIVNQIVSKDIDKEPSKFDAYVFEKKIYDIKLNGYSVNLYNNRQANKIEISYSVSLSEKAFIDELKHNVNKIIHIKNHSFHSALLTQYLAIPNKIANNSEYIYMHVHGELTDIIIVKNRQCKYISSFPFGIKTLLRKIGEVTNHSIEASDSVLTLYYADKLSESEKKKIKSLIDGFSAEFSKVCTDLFSKAFNILQLPKTLYLSTHSHFDFFKNSLISQNEIPFEILSFKDFVDKDNEDLLNMYTHVLSDML